MLINNTIESSRKPGIPGPHRPDLKWFKDALDGKSDVGHVHKKKDIEDFEHNHDGRYYRKDEHELQLLLSGNGTPNFNQGINGDYYVDELNGDLYKKSGDAWNLIIHLEGEQGAPGPQGNPGVPGPQGNPGKEGYTPVRGTDYWTPEDEEIIRQSIVSEVQLGLSNKVDKIEGKGLSTEDFTTLLKQKLEELQNYDDRDIRELLEKALYNVTIDVKTGILTFHTIDESTFTVDLPLELIVSDGYLNKDTNTIVLVLANGNTIDIPVENLIKDFYSKSEVDQKIGDLAEEVNADIKNINDELDETKLEFDSRISANEQAVQNDKSEFQSETLEGDSLYFDDAAERPLSLVPYGEPVQEVIEEELGTTVEGESVVVSDGDPEKEVYDVIYGNSYQETTEGYNIFDLNNYGTKTINGVKVTQNEDGSFNANGTGTSAYITFKDYENITDKLEDGETYTLWCNKPSALFYSQVQITPIEGSVQYITTGNSSPTFKVNKSANSKYLIKLQSGASSKDATYDLSNLQFMLYKGTEAKPYEPYTNGASPNIEYPQEVEVVEGVNKLQIDETNWELTDNGIKCLGKVGISTGVSLSAVDINLKANVTYYLNFVLLSRPTNSVSFSTYIDKVTNDSISFFGLEKTANYTLGQVVTKAYTPTKDEVLKVVMWGNANAEIFEFQYWITTVPNTPYLPYGHIGLVQRGKNYFKAKEDYTSNGLKLTNLQDGSIKIEGTATANSNFSISNYFKLKGEKTFSLEIINGVPPALWYWNRTDSNSNITLTKDILKKTANFNDYKELALSMGVKSGTSYSFIVKLQIEDGLNATSFEPYIEPIVKEINLNGNSIAKVGEIADLLNIGVDGSCKINENIKRYVFTGDENWQLSTGWSSDAYKCFFATILQDTKFASWEKVYQKSNYFIAYSRDELSVLQGNGIGYSGLVNDGINTNNAPITVKIDSSVASTVDELKAWLKEKYNSGNPVYVDYQLAKSETINLPSIEPIEMIKGITNVFELVTNLGTTMAVTYNYVTPSPSIDRPSEILTVKGSYDTDKVNQNLYDINDIFEKADIYKVNEDDSISISYNNTGTSTKYFNYYTKKTKRLKTNTKYYAICEILNASGSGIIQFVSSYPQNDSQVDSPTSYAVQFSSLKAGDIKIVPFITKDDFSISNVTNMLRTFCQFNAGQSGSITFRISVLKDEPNINNFKYLPFKSDTLPLTISKELLGEIVTLTEEEATALNLDGAGKYMRTDYGRLTDISTMDNYIAPNVVQGFNIKIPNIDNDNANLLMKSNKQKINTYYGTYWKKYDGNLFGLLYPTDNPKTVYFNKLMENQTIGEVKKWWADNGIELIYPLQTPTYEKITDETELEQLSAYDKQIAFFGINNINTYPTDNLEKAPLKLKATYDKSNRIIIERQAETITSQDKRITALEATVNTLLGGK